MNIRPATLRAYLAGLFTGTLMTAALVVTATPAKADIGDADIIDYGGIVCAVLDDGYASFNGIIGIGRALMDEGYTAREAGQIVGIAIRDICPQYIPLLRRFAQQYGDHNGAVA